MSPRIYPVSATPKHPQLEMIEMRISDVSMQIYQLTQHLKSHFPSVFSSMGDFVSVNTDMALSMLSGYYLEGHGPQMQILKAVREHASGYNQVLPELMTFAKYDSQENTKFKNAIQQRLTQVLRFSKRPYGVTSDYSALKVPLSDMAQVWGAETAIGDKMLHMAPLFRKVAVNYNTTHPLLFIPFYSGVLESFFIYDFSTNETAFYIYHPVEKLWLRDEKLEYVDLSRAVSTVERYLEVEGYDTTIRFHNFDDFMQAILATISSVGTQEEFIEWATQEVSAEGRPAIRFHHKAKTLYWAAGGTRTELWLVDSKDDGTGHWVDLETPELQFCDLQSDEQGYHTRLVFTEISIPLQKRILEGLEATALALKTKYAPVPQDKDETTNEGERDRNDVDDAASVASDAQLDS